MTPRDALLASGNWRTAGEDPAADLRKALELAKRDHERPYRVHPGFILSPSQYENLLAIERAFPKP